MEKVKENKSVVTSYRLSQDAKDKLQQQLKDLDMTQEQYFNKAVGFMELENVKQNSFLAKDTITVQSNLESILNAFISIADSSNNLIGNKDVELEDLMAKYKDMLSDKESFILGQKQELQENYSKLVLSQTQNKEYESELSNIKTEHNKQLEQLEGNLKDKNLIVDEYKGKNDDLLSGVTEYKQFKVELEEYKKLLADSQARNIDLSNSIREKDYDINQLNKIIEKLPKDHQKELEQLNKENALNIKLAVAEIKENLNNKLSQEQFKHNKDIELYQLKYKDLLEELEMKRTILKAIKKVRVTSNTPVIPR